MENVRYVPEILAFLAVFLLVTLLLKMIERILKDVVKGANLGSVNKVLGAVFGLVEGIALTAIILFVLSVQPFANVTRMLEESIFAQILLPLLKLPMDRGRDIINTAFLIPGPHRFQA